MRTHFIAIGGAAMHNLALALHHKGYRVTGSDDAIFEPSRTRLEKYGLLPPQMGWFPERITSDIEAIILGMHAKPDNPELLRAQELGLKIYSYPEFLYEQSKHKTRVVIGGSHGKTTITSMILHVMHYHNIEVDYMVGAQLEGFDTMVHLTQENDFIVLEGDEYLSSAMDRRPKFHLYQPNIALISGMKIMSDSSKRSSASSPTAECWCTTKTIRRSGAWLKRQPTRYAKFHTARRNIPSRTEQPCCKPRKAPCLSKYLARTT